MANKLNEPGMEPDKNMRSQPPSMLCPVCNVTLTMSNRQDVEIDYCPQCRGVWLDRGELDKIIDRSAAEAVPPQREPDPRGRSEYEYSSRGGHQGSSGKHGGGGKHGSRRKSWLYELFD